MTAKRNQYGLSKDIPDPIKQQVRQTCGFGCVICGASLIEYEHIDPEFPDAKSHDPFAIALLCPYCHGNVTRKFWSKEKVKAALGAPRCKEKGFSWGAFDFGSQIPEVRFAGCTFQNCQFPLLVRGVRVFWFEEPEQPGGPFRLTSNFFDSTGKPVLEIEANEWKAYSDLWDAEFTGGRIIIREREGLQCLVLRADPPHAIVVERVVMNVRGLELIGNTEKLSYGVSGCYSTMSGGQIHDSQFGMIIR